MRAKPVLIVGHSPNAAGDPPMSPFRGGTAGGRLFNMSGWSLSYYVAKTARINLLSDPSDSTAFAKSLAKTLMTTGFMDERYVVVVGRSTASYFPIEFKAWGEWVDLPDLSAKITWVPHTSGLSRHWNTEAERQSLAAFFGDLKLRIRDKVNP